MSTEYLIIWPFQHSQVSSVQCNARFQWKLNTLAAKAKCSKKKKEETIEENCECSLYQTIAATYMLRDLICRHKRLSNTYTHKWCLSLFSYTVPKCMRCTCTHCVPTAATAVTAVDKSACNVNVSAPIRSVCAGIVLVYGCCNNHSQLWRCSMYG